MTPDQAADLRDALANLAAANRKAEALLAQLVDALADRCDATVGAILPDMPPLQCELHAGHPLPHRSGPTTWRPDPPPGAKRGLMVTGDPRDSAERRNRAR